MNLNNINTDSLLGIISYLTPQEKETVSKVDTKLNFSIVHKYFSQNFAVKYLFAFSETSLNNFLGADKQKVSELLEKVQEVYEENEAALTDLEAVHDSQAARVNNRKTERQQDLKALHRPPR